MRLQPWSAWTHCPRCLSEDIALNHYRLLDGRSRYVHYCYGCGHRWQR